MNRIPAIIGVIGSLGLIHHGIRFYIRREYDLALYALPFGVSGIVAAAIWQFAGELQLAAFVGCAIASVSLIGLERIAQQRWRLEWRPRLREWRERRRIR